MEEPITDAEREHLARMLTAPGYKVLLKIQRSYIEALEEGALIASQHNPLANRDEIALAWAYVACGKKFHDAIAAGVKYEISLLEKRQEVDSETEEQKNRRRRYHVLGGYGNPPDSFK